MKFAHPEILWALMALSIPILVHLFNFRRFKRVAFSNVAFLKEVQLETKSKNKLKHLLILLSRLLAVALIVMAFAQPFIPLDDDNNVPGARQVSIYIDNSFSMEASSGEGRLIDLAKARASEVLAAYKATDRFQVLTNDLEGRQERFYDQEAAQEMIDEIEVSPAIRSVPEILERQQNTLLEDEGERTAFLFTDLQRNTHMIGGFQPDSSLGIRFVPDLASRPANVYIDSVWFDTPVRSLGQSEVLNVRIRNTAESGQENVPMKLDINGQQAAIGSFNIVPGTYTDTALYFTNATPGFKHCRLGIQDHPVTYDDTWYFGYELASTVDVLLVKGESSGRAFRNIFSNDPFYRFTEVSDKMVNFGELNRYQLVILDQVDVVSSGLTAELVKFMKAGSTVLFVPSAGGDRNSWNELLLAAGAPVFKGPNNLETKVASLNLDHLLYQGVFDRIPENMDLPKVQRYYGFDRNARSGEEVLMRLQNGEPFFFRSKADDGQLFVMASALNSEWSNFSQHALFVSSVLRVAELSQNSERMSITIGNDEVLNLNGSRAGNEDRFEIRSIQGEQAYIPRHRNVSGGVEIFTGDQLLASGNYSLNIGDSTLMAIGMNYSRSESELEAWTPEAWQAEMTGAGWDRATVVNADLETIGKTVAELDEGMKLWDRFLWLALIMLLIEIVLIKFWKS